MLGARPVDEIHVMRKIVIDGSNTTGFQRTCIIALGGEITVDGKRIGIQTISLEEDAARKIAEEEAVIRYRIDRLCMPLVEVATAPEISSPEEAEKAALVIGRILRATRKVKRGLGTIRQDLNISIERGALTEVKGVQELELVAPVIEAEVMRQVNLLSITEELRSRGIKKEDLREDFVDVSSVFKDTKCKVLREALRRGFPILALRLPGFSGLLGKELAPGLRFGTELSDYAKFWGRVEGILHTDELPGYGVTADEIRVLRENLRLDTVDAVVMVAHRKENALDALSAVLERARAAILGVPSETRAANPDGTTRYSRPRPGAARMYPETDVPPLVVNPERISILKATLPPLPDVRLMQLIHNYGLNKVLAYQILDSEHEEIFERLVKETHISPPFIAATLVEGLKSLRREGFKLNSLSDNHIYSVFKAVDSGAVAKEAILEILRWLAQNPTKSWDDAVRTLKLEVVTYDKLKEFVEKIVRENEELIRERGTNAFGPLMSILMRELRGKVDARMAGDALRKAIELILDK
jgi:glutamyl-tRNA(Gln) amidotransferase subunit E